MQRFFIKYLVLIVASTFLFSGLSDNVHAQTASDFLNSGAQNNLISNENFVDVNSMNTDQIQAFLVTNNSFLKDYSDGGKSAAQIIYEAAKGLSDASVGTAKGISIDSNTGTVSPKVILVFLQKEQSLISRSDRDDNALNKAMGYMCPDGSGCDPKYAGFATQVGWGAWQLRYNYEAAQKGVDWWNEKYGAGNDSIAYVGMPKTLYDYTNSYNVTYSNAATASVYRYTPHVFDSAYNVWNLFNYAYFSGATPSSPPPPPPKPVKPGDINSDDKVDLLDLSLFANGWGQTGLEENKNDLNGDGSVEIQDLSILASHWEG